MNIALNTAQFCSLDTPQSSMSSARFYRISLRSLTHESESSTPLTWTVIHHSWSQFRLHKFQTGERSFGLHRCNRNSAEVQSAEVG